jgi:hypothetical protein
VEGWRNPLEYLDVKYKFDNDSDIVEIIPLSTGGYNPNND